MSCGPDCGCCRITPSPPAPAAAGCPLDRALHELGMLAAVTDSRWQYLSEDFQRRLRRRRRYTVSSDYRPQRPLIQPQSDGAQIADRLSRIRLEPDAAAEDEVPGRDDWGTLSTDGGRRRWRMPRLSVTPPPLRCSAATTSAAATATADCGDGQLERPATEDFDTLYINWEYVSGVSGGGKVRRRCSGRHQEAVPYPCMAVSRQRTVSWDSELVPLASAVVPSASLALPGDCAGPSQLPRARSLQDLPAAAGDLPAPPPAAAATSADPLPAGHL